MIIEERVRCLEDYLHRLIKEGVFPGASFSLLDQEHSCMGFLGKAQMIPESIPVEEDTIYDLASLTKVIATTSCIMLLIERGYITLDTEICEILPLCSQRDICIRHLLTHTSGLDADIDWTNMNKEQLLHGVYNSSIKPSRFEKEVVYSDIGFILLGLIIEQLTGSFEEFVQKNLFKPLKMKETFFNPKEAYIKRCAATEFCELRNEIIRGVVHDEKAYLLGGIAGHAGLFSTIGDITNFVKMYLKDGVFEEQRILNQSTISLMASSYTPYANSERGLGWMLNRKTNIFCDAAGERTLYHTGFTGTSIIIDLDNKKGFVLLTNRVHPTRKNTKLIDLRRHIHNMAFSAIQQ
ncbi:MAG: serine hydrolase domain-containing protein [Thermotaleaceae bacterium]